MSEKYIDVIGKQGEEGLALAKTKPGQALKTVLKDLPVREKNAAKHLGDQPDKKDEAKYKQYKKDCNAAFQECKKAAVQAVLQVILAISQNQMEKAVDELDDDERDTLMKFVYRGFSEEEVDGSKIDYSVLLKCHDAIYKKCGTGPIIRSIHTRLEV